MAQLTITVPDALVPRVVAALTWAYPNEVDPATMTNAEIARRCLRRWIRDTVARYESRQVTAGAETEAKTARDTAFTDMGAIT